eukprot:6374468-Prymnesium_polylepis.1
MHTPLAPPAGSAVVSRPRSPHKLAECARAAPRRSTTPTSPTCRASTASRHPSSAAASRCRRPAGMHRGPAHAAPRARPR